MICVQVKRKYTGRYRAFHYSNVPGTLTLVLSQHVFVSYTGFAQAYQFWKNTTSHIMSIHWKKDESEKHESERLIQSTSSSTTDLYNTRRIMVNILCVGFIKNKYKMNKVLGWQVSRKNCTCCQFYKSSGLVFYVKINANTQQEQDGSISLESGAT